MGATYNGRLFSLIEEQKQPVAMIWDGQVMDLDGWIIPAGLSPERQARALDYIMFATDTHDLQIRRNISVMVLLEHLQHPWLGSMLILV